MTPQQEHEGGARELTLITGGAGFIGTNLADRLLRLKQRVRILDNLSRPGVQRNLAWLEQHYGGRIEVELGDVRNPASVRNAMRDVTRIYHFAAQVAVTTSLTEPAHDFEINARGTLNVLEAVRLSPHRPSIVFTSTNKVYGHLSDIPLIEAGKRYRPSHRADLGGVAETRSLDFCSPYGCSKGAADQYVLDYAHTFSIPATVFRMSCIYGTHQHGNEDQGWVAHFLLRVLQGQPITLYGDGRQVRDLLYVEDLLNALVLAQTQIERLSGRAFNLGGGPERSISLLELLDLIGELHGAPPEVEFAPWRVADQRYFVSNTSLFRQTTGWFPGVSVRAGVTRLYQWLQENQQTGRAPAAAAAVRETLFPNFSSADPAENRASA